MSETEPVGENLIVGVWAPISGNPAETMEYGADGSVRMAILGGEYHMPGRYRFIEPDVIELAWGESVVPEAENVIGAINSQLQERGVKANLGVVRKSLLGIAVSENELITLHLDKGRVGRFRRVIARQ